MTWPTSPARAHRPLPGLRPFALALLTTTALHPALAHAEDAPAAPATEAAGDPAAIVVNGKQIKPPVATGALGSRSLQDTPFSVGQATKEDIARMGATTIDAAFAYDAGIRSNNTGVASGNTFSVRGIAIDRTNGYKLDGLAFPYWFQDHPVEHLENIQVLKGAGGFVYGFAAPGGVVNLVSKQPTRDFQAIANVSVRSSSIWRAAIDVGGPLGQEGDLGFRLNAVNEQGTLYNGAYNRDQFVSLALTGKITDRLTWGVDGFYQRTLQQNQVNSITFLTAKTTINGQSYNAVTSLPATGGNFEPGALGSTKFNDVLSLTAKLHYQIAPNWKATFASRYAVLDERFPGSLATIINSAGDYYSTAYNMNRLFRYYVNDLNVEGTFETGPIKHQVVAGLSSITVEFDYDNPTPASVLKTGTGTYQLFNVYNPASQPSINGNASALANNRSPEWSRYQNIHQRAAFVSDTLSYGPVSLLVGARYTDYEEQNFNPNFSTSSYFHYHPLSPVYSLSLDVTRGVRAYATYVEALQRGGLAPATVTNPNASFGPLKTTQWEAGVKAEGHWGNATLAFYRIGSPSEYTNAATNTFVRDGNARYQGIEANVALHPTRDLTLNGSLALLDAKQIGGPYDGQHIAGTTGTQANASFDYALPFAPGFSVNGGVRYSGKAYGVGEIFVFPEATVGDLGAAKTFSIDGHEVILRAYVQNFTDKHYWVPNAGGTGLSAGAPRTFSASVQVALNGHDGLPAANPLELNTGSRAGHPYIGLDAGVALPQAFNASATDKVGTTGAIVGNALKVRQQTGWDVDGVLGYDYGRFRTEVEAGFKRYGVGAIDYNNASVPVIAAIPANAALGIPAHSWGTGSYGNAGGRTGVLSILANALVNVGPSQSRWGGFVGGGIGIARVTTGHWALDKSLPGLIVANNATGTPSYPTYFSDDNITSFAWQGLAGVHYAIGKHTDITLKYRYFVVPNLHLRTTNANEIDGRLSSHSVLLGATFHL